MVPFSVHSFCCCVYLRPLSIPAFSPYSQLCTFALSPCRLDSLLLYPASSVPPFTRRLARREKTAKSESLFADL